MRRSLTVLALAVLSSSLVMIAIGGAHNTVEAVEILLPLGLVALVTAHVAAARRLGLRTLRRRFELSRWDWRSASCWRRSRSAPR